MKKNILIVGNYGIDGSLDGQTAKTRNVTNTVKKICGSYNIVAVDTAHKNIFSIIKFIYYSINSKKIIIMPAQRSLVPLVYFLNFFRCSKKVIYIVIGGWLDDFIGGNKRLESRIKKFNCVLVELKSLSLKLNKRGINSIVFPNYRIYNNSIKRLEKGNKLVFYSRVTKFKGVLLAINAINDINKKFKEKDKKYLDIYGPIDEEFKDNFHNLVDNNKYINYKGVLNGNETIIETLSQYYLMIFPTFYDGEGFPGAVLEALIAGIPVIATDWKYNSEIITNNYDGLIIKPKSIKDLKNKIMYAYENKKIIDKMSKNALHTAKYYDEENAINILNNILFGVKE